MSKTPNTSQSPTSSSVQSPTMLSAQPKKGVASRRVRALLAGGLVLGVGAAITLAAWNDSEFATGTFAAGSFNLQGSTTGLVDSFDDHPTGSKAALSFTTDVVGNLSPNDVVAAPFVLRLDAATTTNANVTVSSATTVTDPVTVIDTTDGHLTYSVIKVDDVLGCTPAATAVSPNIIVAAGTAFDAIPVNTSFTLDQGTGTGTAEAAPGANVYLCLLVTADSTLIQGSSAIATWNFAATSVTP